MILTIRTDKPVAEIGLYEDDKKIAYETWQAHRQLSDTLHLQIAKNLQFVGREWGDIEGVVAYEGPGSFTGLRIGLTVANSMAMGLGVPAVASGGENWIEEGLQKLKNTKPGDIALPKYGAEANTTLPRK